MYSNIQEQPVAEWIFILNWIKIFQHSTFANTRTFLKCFYAVMLWWWFLNDVRKLVARITWRRFHSLPSFVVFVCFSNLIECYCYCYCSISFVVAVAVWIKLPRLYYCTTRRSKQNKNKNKKRAILAHQPVTNGDNSDGISSKKERKLLAQVVVVFIDQYLPSYRTTTTTNSNLD